MAKIVKVVKKFHHSDQMYQRSQVSRVTLCMLKVKVKVPWVSEWQGHLLSCSGQLKKSNQICMPKLYRNDNDDNIQSLSFILIILYTKSWHGWSQKIRINFALWSKIRPPPKLGSLKLKSLTVKLILDAKNFQPGVFFYQIWCPN